MLKVRGRLATTNPGWRDWIFGEGADIGEGQAGGLEEIGGELVVDGAEGCRGDGRVEVELGLSSSGDSWRKLDKQRVR
jgi:hypothetical protein